MYLAASTRSQVATARHGDHGFPTCRIVCPDIRDKRCDNTATTQAHLQSSLYGEDDGVAKMASHAIFQYNILVIDIDNTTLD